MKKKLTLTIDDDVYEGLGELPRKVSISEITTWVLRVLIADIQGISDEDLKKLVDSDPRGREVRDYLSDKLGPFFDSVDSRVEKIKKKVKVNKRKK